MQSTTVSDRRSGQDRRDEIDGSLEKIMAERRRDADRRSGSNRRKLTRYQMNDLVLVKLKSGREVKVGQLLDISQRGFLLIFPQIRVIQKTILSWKYFRFLTISRLKKYLSPGSLLFNRTRCYWKNQDGTIFGLKT